ncbi:hypothetical protein K437DRAFT_108039 [Tilletiaria anomala UBC 951]|uniref:Uncharacterized protein n=1 Tax=Tilletiaria anomala (strain ATCC 24038 / CBS 436.72 / UBC 951) TaxID=1037660 RepID=A0A066W6T9_TILAU|nr:uncharacterized protein K437DRAFT_108039 [Tilletiaria anomala UBC 951]KDN46490.1 hypothetical protein K437DRAFT_108039 [Tilletiaria anomala UBC 951]
MSKATAFLLFQFHMTFDPVGLHLTLTSGILTVQLSKGSFTLCKRPVQQYELPGWRSELRRPVREQVGADADVHLRCVDIIFHPVLFRTRLHPTWLACSSKVEIRPKEPIRCKECGHRIVYKPRTTKMLHFEAR